jgi:class 3 adenylate cyclase
VSTEERAIVFVDVVGSTALKVEQGDSTGAAEVANKLNKIEAALVKADPTAKRHGPSEGDSFLLIGSNTLALFKAAVNFQALEMVWNSSMSVRISVGRGAFEAMPDGNFQSLRGSSIDMARRILEYCNPFGVVITEYVREIVRSAGLGGSLTRCEEELKGFGLEVFYTTGKEDRKEGVLMNRRLTDMQVVSLTSRVDEMDSKLGKHMKEEENYKRLFLTDLTLIKNNTAGIVEAWEAISGGLKILKFMAYLGRLVAYMATGFAAVWAFTHISEISWATLWHLLGVAKE